ncbi:MAG: ABC transporter permease [Eubacteriales bacterium]|nr:ABC transporter permease [Eubacteriales bacterium]
MKKGLLRGWREVFGFTFRRHVSTRGYRTSTILVSLLLVVLIAGGMLLTDILISSDSGSSVQETAITKAVFVNETGAQADWSVYGLLGGLYGSIPTEQAQSVQEAAETIGETELIVLVEQDAHGLNVRALRPENSLVSEEDALAYANYISAYIVAPLAIGMEIDPAALQATFAGSYTVLETAQDEGEESGGGLAGELMDMIVPYVMVMIMYFMVLAYGQSVAGSVIMEKTSKLMDLFLVSVRPGALLLGKLLAIAATAILQLAAWIASAVAGLALGTALVRAVNPDTTLGLIRFLEIAAQLGTAFSPVGILLGVLFCMSGFLLYCALSAFGGALASKPEDLSSTNALFTMILIISFLGVLYSNPGEMGMIPDEGWYPWIPFVSILVMPGKLMLGKFSVGMGLASMAIVLVTAFAITLLAGKAYALCTFRKGEPVKPTQIFSLLRQK